MLSRFPLYNETVLFFGRYFYGIDEKTIACEIVSSNTLEPGYNTKYFISGMKLFQVNIMCWHLHFFSIKVCFNLKNDIIMTRSTGR